MNTLVIGGPLNGFKQCGIEAKELYRSIPFFLKPLRQISLKYNQMGLMNWIDNRSMNVIGRVETVILFDNQILPFITHYIADRYSDKRLILFFWNPLSVHHPNILQNISSNWELWTFDKHDAETKGLKYAGQFFFNLLTGTDAFEKQYDMYFVGINKGRFHQLIKFEEQLINRGIKCNFRLVSKYKSLFSRRYCSFIPYKQVQEEIAKSKAVLEWNQACQQGVTLRCLEAISTHKKLVSNNLDLKRYKFFHPDNIFLVGDRPLDELPDFLESDYTPINEKLIKSYHVDEWLKRILDNIELDDTIC